MTERETTGRQTMQGQNGINQVSSAPPQRRRRTKKKKKSNFKKYLEWIAWGVAIIVFLGTIVMLLSQFKGDGKKPKASIENSGTLLLSHSKYLQEQDIV